MSSCYKTESGLGFPAFSLIEEANKTNMVKSMNKISSSVCAIPFLSKKTSGDICDHKSFDGIKEKLNQNGYTNTQEVFEDLNALFSPKCLENPLKIHLKCGKEESHNSIVILPEDMEKIGRQMRAKLATEAERLFTERQIHEVPMAAKILAVLQTRFRNISEDRLKLSAVKLAGNKDGDWKYLVNRLHQENENEKEAAAFQKFSFFPSKEMEPSGEHSIHHYIAGTHFHRMLMKWSEPNVCLPVHLRKVCITCFITPLFCVYCKFCPGSQSR